jgi:hypothetical protein
VTVRPAAEVVHDARSGQPVHCAAKSTRPEPFSAVRMAAVLPAGQVTSPVSRSTVKSSLPKRPARPVAEANLAIASILEPGEGLRGPIGAVAHPGRLWLVGGVSFEQVLDGGRVVGVGRRTIISSISSGSGSTDRCAS